MNFEMFKKAYKEVASTQYFGSFLLRISIPKFLAVWPPSILQAVVTKHIRTVHIYTY